MAPERPTSDLARAIQDVTERAQIVIREEIELAKVEVTQKATRFAKGAAAGAAAGIFLLAALIYFLHALSWFLYVVISDDGSSIWIGYLVTVVILVLFAAVAGFLAYRFVKKALPPAPQMTIEEAQRIRDTVKSPPGPEPRGLEEAR